METAQNEPLLIGQTINLLLDRCENCGYGIKYRDKKWCARCIDVYTRKHGQSSLCREKIIMELVGSLYYPATIETVDVEVQIKLRERKSGQDDSPIGQDGAYPVQKGLANEEI